MRAFRMAYLTNAWHEASDSEQPQSSDCGVRGCVQAGLRSGDASLGLEGTSNANVLEDIKAVDDS